MTDRIGAAVVGTGLIGGVHARAILRNGADLRGVLGSSPERGRERAAAMHAPRAYASMDDLLSDDAVQVIHVTSPNHLHHEQVMRVIDAGKHVICEKPLAVTTAQSAEMVRAADASGVVCAVCYNIRFYPLNQHAHAMIAAGGLGEPRFLTGHYHQDWLSEETDWNWRLSTEKAGPTRAVGDIGTHWVDLTSFVAGMKPTAVIAEMATFLPTRHEPTGPVETFSASDGDAVPREIRTEDAATMMLRYPNGARGAVTVSQVNVGRKNSLTWDVAGSKASAAWDSERPDHLFIGHRHEANRILQRDAALMNATGAAAAALPGGHVEGFGDTFAALFAQIYGDVAAGGRSDRATYASFADGHWEVAFCEAVVESARTGRWTEIAP